MPPQKPKIVTLTKAQLTTKEGAELADLCRRVAGDGRISDVEIGELKSWLDRNASADFPAVHFLRSEIATVLEDDTVSDSERLNLHRAIERVLPVDLRADVVQARKEVTEAERLTKGRIVAFYSKVRGVSFQNRDGSSRSEIIARLRPGEALWPVRDLAVPGHPNAIKLLTDRGEQVGYIATEISSSDGEEGLASRMDRGIRVECRAKNVTGDGEANIGLNIELAYWKGHAEGQPSGPLLQPFEPDGERPHRIRSNSHPQQTGCLSLFAINLAAAVVVFWISFA